MIGRITLRINPVLTNLYLVKLGLTPALWVTINGSKPTINQPEGL